jgi:hypothetical protein
MGCPEVLLAPRNGAREVLLAYIDVSEWQTFRLGIPATFYSHLPHSQIRRDVPSSTATRFLNALREIGKFSRPTALLDPEKFVKKRLAAISPAISRSFLGTRLTL